MRDRRDELLRCLESLARQVDAPAFEVLVVDDGSHGPLRREELTDFPFSITLLRQIPLGISAARNLGVSRATAGTILFIDSDCVAQEHLLCALQRCMERFPDDATFQLELASRDATMSQRMEWIRLEATQEFTRTREGYIRYLNTSGFALRRSYLTTLAGEDELFDPSLLRGEDTLLLARLYEHCLLPRRADGCVVYHCPSLGTWQYVRRHWWVGYHTGAARESLAITAHGLVSDPTAWDKFTRIHHSARTHPGRWQSFALIAVSHALELVGRACHACFGIRRGRARLLTTVLDRVRERELLARIVSSATRRRSLLVTYETAWTLVLAASDRKFSRQLEQFDIVYADGVGVVLTLLITRLRRTHKVTANDFFMELCDAAAQRGLRVAFIGGTSEVIERLIERLAERVPELDVVFRSNGYLGESARAPLIESLREARPQLVLLGMGQPLQEQWALELRERLPGTVLFCVGALFEYFSGVTPLAPAWVRRCGLEWCHRLAHNPRRLWRRYLVGIPALSWLVARHLFSEHVLGGGRRLGRWVRSWL